MKLVNLTDLHGTDLRAFLRACLQREGVDPRVYRLTVWWRRGRSRVLGRASMAFPRITLFVPRPTGPVQAELPPETVVLLAATMAHEVAHTRGVDHRHLAGGCMVDTAMGEWARGRYVLRVLVEAPAQPRDLVAEREAAARLALSRWERKLKLARTKVRSYQQTVRYYERRAAGRAAAADRGAGIQTGAAHGAAMTAAHDH